ncbi:MAG: hypothetical protein ABSF86_21680 [Steroidobacteraceae bacterium]|jgi:hypothetical protein
MPPKYFVVSRFFCASLQHVKWFLRAVINASHKLDANVDHGLIVWGIPETQRSASAGSPRDHTHLEMECDPASRKDL